MECNSQSERPTVEQQYKFSDGGQLEPESESVETDLQAWGAVDAEPERETRIEREAASEFGVDDRTTVEQEEQTEQADLVADVSDDQQTLGGQQAAGRSVWGDD